MGVLVILFVREKENAVKVPRPRKMASGKWLIQLRLDGKRIPVTDFDKSKCIKEAKAIQAEYLAKKRTPRVPEKAVPSVTLEDAIDSFIKKRTNTLSPSTIRGYECIKNNRFQDMMHRDVYQVTENEWMLACNREAAKCSPKTLANAWAFIATVLKQEVKLTPPSVALPQIPPNERPFLSAEQIPIFVKAVKGTEVEIPALLALSSLRRSEICALTWENVDLQRRLIHVKGAAVFNEDHKLVQKKSNKNRSSVRSVPIMMDELAEALEKNKKESGLLMGATPNTILRQINRICKDNGLPEVGIHGLRHSFASLAKHIGMPEQVTMEIGGWSNPQTMRRIYTHISQKDANRYKNAMTDFYKNGGKAPGETGGKG